ncbi:uncharacterized protein DNG_06198 [Cephalotrichum gorgonifer]|uniref:Prion-inhibition and propagation HeLo domain-containing protein n=1 Tax=Cephalotrichum gorgonifer TaxID=2041049 RepID=A0AAE8MZG8_9PEZI|nr:uncharacterized protein DNG_06198 [Cephalotrichum gorgonifer]
MAELALGVLGVAGLFSATLDVWSFVDAGQGYAQSFTRLRTRLDLQRTLFVNWGKSVGFGTEEGHHRKLEDHPDTHLTVRNVLTEIYLILSETDRLALKYGVRMLEEGEERPSVAVPRRLLPIPSARPGSIFRPKYEEFRLLFRRRTQGSGRTEKYPMKGVQLAAAQQLEATRQRQRSSSIWVKARWAIRDEDKMERLVRDLAELVSGLRALTVDIVDEERERQIADQTVSDIDSVDSLRQIQEASLEASPLSVSVSERLLSLESGPSGGTTYYSARSRLSEAIDGDSVYGTGQPPRASYLREQMFLGDDWAHSSESESSDAAQERTLEIVEELNDFDLEGDLASTLEDEDPTPSLEGHASPNLEVHPPAPSPIDLSEHPSGTGPTDSLAADGNPISTPAAAPKHSTYLVFEATITGPPETSYSGGQFRLRYWLCDDAGCYRIYIRFLTWICHPLVDSGGFLHGKFRIRYDLDIWLKSAPYEAVQIIDYILRNYHWTSPNSVFDGESIQVQHLERRARAWTKAYATYTSPPDPTSAHILRPVGISDESSLPQVSLNQPVWNPQGAEELLVTFLEHTLDTWGTEDGVYVSTHGRFSVKRRGIKGKNVATGITR